MDCRRRCSRIRRQAKPRENPIDTTTLTPAPACFGVTCPCRGRCQRYHAVGGSAADLRVIVTCRVGNRFPLFVECEARQPAAA